MADTCHDIAARAAFIEEAIATQVAPELRDEPWLERGLARPTWGGTPFSVTEESMDPRGARRGSTVCMRQGLQLRPRSVRAPFAPATPWPWDPLTLSSCEPLPEPAALQALRAFAAARPKVRVARAVHVGPVDDVDGQRAPTSDPYAWRWTGFRPGPDSEGGARV